MLPAVLLAAASPAAVLTEEYVAANIDALWGSFKAAHGRAYTGDEEELRRRTFAGNMRQAARLQARNPLASFGVNSLSDTTEEEFARMATGLRPKPPAQVPDLYTPEQLNSTASAVDWRTRGAVTAVKNQGDCGGCWSFSATGNIEGQWQIAGHKLTALSEQELLSCDDYFPCMGCSGGEMSCAWEFLKSEKGGAIATEASYPYTSGAKGGPVAKCKGGGSTGAKITGYKSLPTNEAQMAAWVAANGPASIGAYAIPWKQYTGGILTDCGSGTPDHAILIVGFGTAKGTDYWIIKNSWGSSWGESGYIRVQRGKNLCKVASQPCSATV